MSARFSMPARDVCLKPDTFVLAANDNITKLASVVKQSLNVKSIQPPHGSEFGLNFVFHVFVLFTALTLLYVKVIAPTESKAITKEISKACVQAVNQGFSRLQSTLTDLPALQAALQAAAVASIAASFQQLRTLLPEQVVADAAAALRARIADLLPTTIAANFASLDAVVNLQARLQAAYAAAVTQAFGALSAAYAAQSQALTAAAQTLIDELAAAATPLIAKALRAPVEVLKSSVPLMQRMVVKYAQPDVATCEHNEKVLNYAYFGIALLAVVLIVFTSALASTGSNMGRPVFQVLMENAVVFLFVGAAEFAFFLTVASKFVPVVPSTLTTTVLKSLQQQFPVPPPA